MKRTSTIASCVLFITVLLMSDAFAQGAQEFQYAVKFMCGAYSGKILARGSYCTAINVHNPADTVVIFRKKFASTLTGEKPGLVTPWIKARLGPDQGLEIDCSDTLLARASTGGFLKGFVVIESNFELDVVAVYTVAGRDGEIRAMDTERVGPRRLPRR